MGLTVHLFVCLLDDWLVGRPAGWLGALFVVGDAVFVAQNNYIKFTTLPSAHVGSIGATTATIRCHITDF